MPRDSVAEWLSSEEAIAHICACIWYRRDGTLRRQLPLSMVARTYLQNALEDGSVRARGPLQGLRDLPPKVQLRWPEVEISSAFWMGAEWDGGSGFRNRSRSELLPWFEVTKNEKELYELWPEADRRSMPAPFDDDWPLLEDVVEAMMQRLGVGKKGALKRLISERPGVIKARKGRGSDSGRVVAKGPPVDLSALSDGIDIRWEDEFRATRGGEPIVVCGEDVVALWPSLVLSESGEIARPMAGRTGTRPLEPSAPAKDHEPSQRIDRFPGRPSAKSEIKRKFEERVAAAEFCTSSLAHEAQWLYAWAHDKLGPEKSLPGSVHTVENHIREVYRQAKATLTAPTK
jgi:hypothetical protein